jgi:hypothetical protein
MNKKNNAGTLSLSKELFDKKMCEAKQQELNHKATIGKSSLKELVRIGAISMENVQNELISVGDRYLTHFRSLEEIYILADTNGLDMVIREITTNE